MRWTVLLLAALAVSGCVRQEVHNATQAIGDASTELTQDRTIDTPGNTKLEVSPASKAEDGQVKLQF